MEDHPFYKIHNVNTKFNKVFNKPLFYVATFVTFLNLFLPYSLRFTLAFFINIFFNRPVVYLNFFAEKINKRINFVTTTLFYFTFIGVYSILYQAYFYISNRRKKESRWVKIEKENKDNYFYQS